MERKRESKQQTWRSMFGEETHVCRVLFYYKGYYINLTKTYK